MAQKPSSTSSAGGKLLPKPLLCSGRVSPLGDEDTWAKLTVFIGKCQSWSAILNSRDGSQAGLPRRWPHGERCLGLRQRRDTAVTTSPRERAPGFRVAFGPLTLGKKPTARAASLYKLTRFHSVQVPNYSLLSFSIQFDFNSI